MAETVMGNTLARKIRKTGAASLSQLSADFAKRAASPRDAFRVYMDALQKTPALPGYNPRGAARALLNALKKRRYPAVRETNREPALVEAGEHRSAAH